MTENEENLVTLKIRLADREWAKDEQARLRRAERKEPTHAELFSRMRSVYEQTISKDNQPIPPSEVSHNPARNQQINPLPLVPAGVKSEFVRKVTDPAFWERVEDLARVWVTEDQQLREWISGNLVVFGQTAAAKIASARSHGGNRRNAGETEAGGPGVLEEADALVSESGEIRERADRAIAEAESLQEENQRRKKRAR